MPPPASEGTVDITNKVGPGVDHARRPSAPWELLPVPRLPPLSNISAPGFHPGRDPHAPVTRRFPSLELLQNKSMRQHPALFATAKWFSVTVVRDYIDIDHSFADGAGMLPGNLPLQAIRSYDWLARIAIPPSILSHTSPSCSQILSTRFVNAVCDRLEIPMTGGLIPLAFGCDTWQYRTNGERPYLDNVVEILGDPPREAHRRWYGRRTVSNDAMLWTQAIIPKGFRHMKRGKLPFFQNTVRYERRIRSYTGSFVAYQMLEAREIARHHYSNRYHSCPRGGAITKSARGFGRNWALSSHTMGVNFAILATASG